MTIEKLKSRFLVPECCRKRKDVSDSLSQQDSQWMPLHRKHLVLTQLFYNFRPDGANLEQASQLHFDLEIVLENYFEKTPLKDRDQNPKKHDQYSVKVRSAKY